jgi:hypothetical protein
MNGSAAKDEAAMAEPAKDEAAKEEAAKDEPAQGEPAQDEPARGGAPEDAARDQPAGATPDAESASAASGSSGRPPSGPPSDSETSGGDEKADRGAASPSAPDPKPSQPSAAFDWDKDCELRHNFRAHGKEAAGDETPYEIPPGEEQLRRFVFVPQWPSGMHMIAARRTGENTRAMHHWGFYTVGDTTTARDGEIIDSHDLVDAFQTQGPGLLVGGGPGTPPLQLPRGVGAVLPVGDGAGFALEVHYFNATEETAKDDFGVELCLTSKPVMAEAAIHVLGAEGYTLAAHAQTDVTSTCRPLNQKTPVHLFAVTPHMHARGEHSKIVLTRGSGEQVSLIDEPYGSEDQRTYALPDVVVEPGDTLTTTCGYDNTSDHAIRYGASVDDEMCFMLLWAWPSGILQNGLPFGGSMAVEEDKDCVEVVL